MIGRHGEVEPNYAVGVGSGLSSLHQMLLKRRARTCLVGVEFKQTLGELTIVETLRADYGCDNIAAASLGKQRAGILAVEICTYGIEIGLEGELVESGQKLAYRAVGCSFVGISVGKLKESLEHARSGS